MDDGILMRDASSTRALLTTLGVAVVCAFLVSYAAVTLRPYYLDNLRAERDAQLASILDALSGTEGGVSPEDIEVRVVALDSGAYTRWPTMPGRPPPTPPPVRRCLRSWTWRG